MIIGFAEVPTESWAPDVLNDVLGMMLVVSGVFVGGRSCPLLIQSACEQSSRQVSGRHCMTRSGSTSCCG